MSLLHYPKGIGELKKNIPLKQFFSQIIVFKGMKVIRQMKLRNSTHKVRIMYIFPMSTKSFLQLVSEYVIELLECRLGSYSIFFHLTVNPC